MLYEFKCNKCKKIFEEFCVGYIPVGENTEQFKCRNCDASPLQVERIYSHNNIRIQWSRGRGFYKPS